MFNKFDVVIFAKTHYAIRGRWVHLFHANYTILKLRSEQKDTAEDQQDENKQEIRMEREKDGTVKGSQG